MNTLAEYFAKKYHLTNQYAWEYGNFNRAENEIEVVYKRYVDDQMEHHGGVNRPPEAFLLSNFFGYIYAPGTLVKLNGWNTDEEIKGKYGIVTGPNYGNPFFTNVKIGGAGERVLTFDKIEPADIPQDILQLVM